MSFLELRYQFQLFENKYQIEKWIKSLKVQSLSLGSFKVKLEYI